jgi:uncharacterized protein (TIGR00299 family) protein
MMLGALIDLGVPIDVIGAALDAVGAGRERLRITRVVKHGVSAVDLKVDTKGHILPEHNHGDEPSRGHGHAPKPTNASGKFVAIKFRAETHERHVHVDELGDKTEEIHGPHYHYDDIRTKLAVSKLSDGTRARALDIFDRLARAESKIHGTEIEDVVFHEVGAIDSVVDVVGTAAALDWLAPASVTCASVAMGHGTLNSAHGVMPVPAPAALEVLRDAKGVMADGGVARELCTPTGAAILASAVTAWTPSPTGRAVAIGWGAGDIDLDDRANVLRVVALQPALPSIQSVRASSATAATEAVFQIDANIDDMSPEFCNPASDAIFAAGALDVWWTPITMKKGRPALTLSALATGAMRDAVIATILRETTTIGVRFAAVERTVLERRTVQVTTRYGIIAVKVAVDGDKVRNAAPEYEACAAAAKQHGVPVKDVFVAALAAYDAKR